MNQLYNEIRSCTLCRDQLPLEPNPILGFNKNSRIVLVSQAPGLKAHNSDIAYQDPSGIVLRKWLGVSETDFYNPKNFAILPMGFCYPGKAMTGDKPPRPECRPTWHDRVWHYMENVKLIILIGRHAQQFYLADSGYRTLTENVRNYDKFLPKYFPIPHPSPLNRRWLAKNLWFENNVAHRLKDSINKIIHLSAKDSV